jgi:hypothetical protein
VSEKFSPALVQRIIRKHGPIIDLRKNPEILIDILRGLDIDGGTPEPPPPDDGGGLPGGVPNPPPAPDPPGPNEAGRRITNEDLMKVVLQLSRDVATMRTSLKALSPVLKAPAKVAKPR